MYVSGSNFTNFCAIFERCEPEPTPLREVIRAGELDQLGRRADDLDQPMLVRIVEFFEKKEGITLTSPPTLVWMEIFDSFLMLRTKGTDHVAPITKLYPFKMRHQALSPSRSPMGSGANKKDGELSISCRFLGIREGQLVDQTIESTMQQVGDDADLDAPSVKAEIGRVHLNAQCLFPRYSIDLSRDDLVIAVTPKKLLGRDQRLEFSCAAPYFEARAIERMCHAELLSIL